MSKIVKRKQGAWAGQKQGKKDIIIIIIVIAIIVSDQLYLWGI